MNQQVVIISGMHRSGTSLTASIIQKAGVNIGDNLYGSSQGNWRGHFEDVDFNAFQEKLLQRFGQSFLVQSAVAVDEILPAETEEALALIAQRNSRALWGWKDPRTSLFLDFWHSLLPQARYVLVYRHPVEVALSLLRRGADFDLEALKNPVAGLYAWQIYNQSILNFYRQHHEICLLAHISAIISDTEAFIDLAAQKLALPLQHEAVQSLYHMEELKQINFSAEAIELLKNRFPEIEAIYQQLEAEADLPGQVFKQNEDYAETPLAEWQYNILGLKENDNFAQAQPDQLFASLLAVLDPQAVLAGKEALDNYRITQITNAEVKAQQLQTHVQQLQTHVQQLQTHSDNLQAQVESLNTQKQYLEQVTITKDAFIYEQKSQVSNLQQYLANQMDQLRSMTTHAGNLETKIETIEQTKIWRLAQKWYTLKRSFQKPVEAAPALAEPPVFVQELSVLEHEPIEVFSTSNQRNGQNSSPTILFISHDGFRAGAPILLLNFLHWLKANTTIPFEILLKEGGELKAEFEALAPTALWGQDAAHINRIKTHLMQANIGLVCANTITNGELLAGLAWLDCPVICYIHELEYWITYRTTQQNIELIKKHTTHFMAGSQAVKQNLVELLQIPAEKVDVVHSFIDISDENDSSSSDEIRRQLNIPPEAFVVGACGTADWRKGPDLFIQLARAVSKHRPIMPVHFVWVGGKPLGPGIGALHYDVKRLGLENCIHFVSTRPNFRDYMTAFDVFTLVSREDPFPLVVLEAAAMAKPILCFDRAGGSNEFVEQDSGFVVPYLDIETMADKIFELIASPELKQVLGQRAAQKVRERHNVAVGSAQMFKIIERFLVKEKEKLP